MEELNYDELYYLVNEKNSDAETILYFEVEKYLRWLCYQKANDFLRKEDIMSYGWQGYIEAFTAYVPENSVTFKSFLYHCIGRRLIDIQRKRNKKSLKGHMSSLLMSEEKVMYIVETKSMTGITDIRLTMRHFWQTLDKKEKLIFRYYIKGVSNKDIATKMNISITAVYKVIRTMRERLKKEL